MVHLMEACLLTALQAYLLGSLLFGVLVSKLFYHDDVRLHGSGNAGMTNVLRTYGKLPAVITTIGDVGKSVVAVKLGQFIFDSLLSGTGADFQPPSSACWATASLSFLACAAAKACWLVPVLR
jgi:glycerol-3-phosphate acyltransferase PlsY